jgi:hypothetical protein
MKRIFLITTTFLLSLSSYPQEMTLSSFGSGRASQISIIAKKVHVKRATCCQAAELTALSNSNVLDSTIRLKGKLKRTNLLLETSGSIKPIKTECTSTLNDFEECKYRIIFDAPNRPPFYMTRGSGWIDEDSYRIDSIGKASRNAIEKDSYAMKETTCIEASKLNAVGNMISSLSKEPNKTYNISLRSPQIWLNSCNSVKNDFEVCTCEITLYDKGLKERVLSKLNE